MDLPLHHFFLVSLALKLCLLFLLCIEEVQQCEPVRESGEAISSVAYKTRPVVILKSSGVWSNKVEVRFVTLILMVRKAEKLQVT